MDKVIHVGIVGDYDPFFPPHPATDKSLRHAAEQLSISVEVRWLPTPSLCEPDGAERLEECQALLIAPGSPYKNMEGALKAIKFGRESGRPTLGTCGGFQHIVIEYARNVLNFKDAEHAEYNPEASRLFINRLKCSLAGQTLSIEVKQDSRAFRCYQNDRVKEQYYCNFGLNPNYQKLLDESGLRVVGTDTDGEARILELQDHPFFAATLFVPQLNSSRAKPHPLIVAHLEAAGGFEACEGAPAARAAAPGVGASAARTSSGARGRP